MDLPPRLSLLLGLGLAFAGLTGCNRSSAFLAFHHGNEKLAAKDYKGAIIDYTVAIRLDSTNKIYYYNRGIAEEASSKFKDAISDFDEVLAKDAFYVNAYYYRGLCRWATKDPAGAIKDFTEVIRVEPKKVDAYYKRANVEREQGNFDLAIEDLTHVLILSPKDANAYSDRGLNWRKKGDLDTALTDYTQAIACDAKCYRAYVNRAYIKNSRKDFAGAKDDCDRALAIEPDYGPALLDRGTANRGLGQLKEAVADYDLSEKANPTSILVPYYRGQARVELGDTEGAMRDFTRAAALSKNALGLTERSYLKRAKDDLDGALADCELAVAANPKLYVAYFARANSHYRQGRWPESIRDYQRSLELDSQKSLEYAVLYLWLAREKAGQHEVADKDLADYAEKHWKEKPTPWKANISRFLLGQISETDLLSAAASSDSKKQNDQQCEGWYFAGMKALFAGDPSTAVDRFKKCLATGQKEFVEYEFATAELKALENLTR